jgi:hypothetical protein
MLDDQRSSDTIKIGEQALLGLNLIYYEAILFHPPSQQRVVAENLLDLVCRTSKIHAASYEWLFLQLCRERLNRKRLDG